METSNDYSKPEETLRQNFISRLFKTRTNAILAGIVVVSLVIVVGAGIYIYRYLSANEINLIRNEPLTESASGTQSQAAGSSSPTTTLEEKYSELNSKTKEYLNLIGQNCTKEAIDCLDNLINVQTGQSGQNNNNSLLKQVKFEKPYSITWQDSGAGLSLTGVSLGEMTINSISVKKAGANPDPASPYYKVGDKIYALVMDLHIRSQVASTCVPMNIRRLLNEEGDVARPNTTQYIFSTSGGCTIYPSEPSDQQVIFVVDPSDKEFVILTGDSSNTSFTVKLLDNNSLKIEKTGTSG